MCIQCPVCFALGIKEPPATGTCSEADNYGAEPGYQSHLAQCPCCKNFVMREAVEAVHKAAQA